MPLITKDRGVEGRSLSTSGIDRGHDEGGEELGQVGVAFDAMEAAFDVQEGGAVQRET